MHRENWRSGGERKARAQSDCSFRISRSPGLARDEVNGVWSFWGITYFGFSEVDLGSLDLPAH